MAEPSGNLRRGTAGCALILLILLTGITLRLHLLARDERLQPDEALFSTFARAAALIGDWFFPGPLDKPPLALYANALAQVVVGEGEFAARLPSTLASILLMPTVYALAWALYRQRATALYALALTAWSPLLLTYSATAYTDLPMLLGITLALLLLARGRWGHSGIWLGLGLAAKLQALLYLPLLIGLGWAQGRLNTRHALRFGVGFGAITLLLLIWDRLRPGLSVFTLAAQHNNPAQLVNPAEMLPRLSALSQHAQYLFGPPWLTVILLLALIWRLSARRPATRIDLCLGLYVLGYGLLHWLLAFDTYERYLLPLLPPLILLVARALSLLRVRFLLLLALLMLTSGPAREDAYSGIDMVAAYLNATPVATVIYDHWLNWELGYYLGQWHDKRMVYYPTPESLVDDALRLDEIGPRYLPVPVGVEVEPWLDALRQAGFGVRRGFSTARFVVYQLIPPWSIDLYPVEDAS